METIKSYLETMFANMPDTPEVIRAKSELFGMMEDKYNELISEGKIKVEGKKVKTKLLEQLYLNSVILMSLPTLLVLMPTPMTIPAKLTHQIKEY